MTELQETILYVVLFVVPGHIAFGAFGAFVTGREPDEKRWLLRSLTASLCYYGAVFAVVGSWLLTADLRRWVDQHERWVSALLALAVLVIVPAGIGATLGALSRVRWLNDLSQRLFPRSLEPTAWDAMFCSATLVGCQHFVCAELDDGSTVAGLWSGASRAGESAHRDLYLDVEYEHQENGRYSPLPMTAGVWIDGSRIRLVRFTRIEEPNESPAETPSPPSEATANSRPADETTA